MIEKSRPAGRVFCSCGHEIQWHSQHDIPGKCLLQRLDGSECPCVDCVPTTVLVLPEDVAYRLVPLTACETFEETDRGALINKLATMGMRLTTLRTELPEVEKQARKTPRRDMHDERAKVEAAKQRVEPMRAEIANLALNYMALHSELIRLGAYPGSAPRFPDDPCTTRAEGK